MTGLQRRSAFIVIALLLTAALVLGGHRSAVEIEPAEAAAKAKANKKNKKKANKAKPNANNRANKKRKQKAPAGCRVNGREVHYGSRSSKRIALTFDETLGPETSHILQTLARHNVKATFFQTGSDIRRRPDLARQIVKQGHELGNHSFSHANFSSLTPKQTRKELKKAQRAAVQVTGYKPCLFRPPFGINNKAASKWLAKKRITTVYWDTGAIEWVNGTEEIVAHLDRTIRPGSIVLFHQVWTSRLALERVIVNAKRKGLQPVTVTELIGGRTVFARR